MTGLLQQQQDRAANRRQAHLDVKRAAAVRYFADTSMSSPEIARVIGVSRDAVRRWRKELAEVQR